MQSGGKHKTGVEVQNSPNSLFTSYLSLIKRTLHPRHTLSLLFTSNQPNEYSPNSQPNKKKEEKERGEGQTDKQTVSVSQETAI